MLIDSHCHLNMSDFTNDLDAIIANAKNNQQLSKGEIS